MPSGKEYPKEEFASIISQQDFGGFDHTGVDELDPYEEGTLSRKQFPFFDKYRGSKRIFQMLRKGDWKLVYNTQGRGKMYYLSEDSAELNDLFVHSKYQDKQMELLQNLLVWELRTLNPLPLPRHRYIYKRDPKKLLGSLPQ